MSDERAIVICGYGVTDALQLTVEAQRVAQESGRVFAVSPPPNLTRYLTANRVRVVDLTTHIGAQSSYADIYLDVVDTVVRHGETDPPSVLLLPGSPLFFDTLTRFLLETARDRGVTASVLPGVSPIDVLVAELGLDVTARGLQMFDARSMVGTRQPVVANTPLVVMGVDALVDDRLVPKGSDPARLFGALARHLARTYDEDHLVTLVSPGSRTSPMTVRLSRFAELVDVVRPGSALFLDVSAAH